MRLRRLASRGNPSRPLGPDYGRLVEEFRKEGGGNPRLHHAPTLVVDPDGASVPGGWPSMGAQLPAKGLILTWILEEFRLGWGRESGV